MLFYDNLLCRGFVTSWATTGFEKQHSFLLVDSSFWMRTMIVGGADEHDDCLFVDVEPGGDLGDAVTQADPHDDLAHTQGQPILHVG